jgi:hypothetical protein
MQPLRVTDPMPERVKPSLQRLKRYSPVTELNLSILLLLSS